MNVSSAVSRCPVCQAVLAPGALTGVCAACAWRALAEVGEDDAAPSAAEERRAAGVLFTVAGHDVLEELARGGAGIVYRARQREPRREVALKMLLPAQVGSAELRARFRAEAELVAGLEHPAILPVYSVGEHDGLPFFTMKLAAGGTLAARRDALRGRWREIAELVAMLAGAVQWAHARGVIHRDVKPGNVLFDEAGRAYVSDFGLAKWTQPDGGAAGSGAGAGAGDRGTRGGALSPATQAVALLGTPAYTAPEVIEHGAGAATTAADVYGLGAVLYELLAGRPPFVAESLPALLRVVVEREPERPSRVRGGEGAGAGVGVPRDLEIVALRALAKEPAQRYATAGELAEELRRWLDGRPIRARPAGVAERVWRWARREPVRAGLAAALVLSLAGGGVGLAAGNRALRAALERTLTAEQAAAQQLHEALLAEARLRRQTGQPGQRFETLERLARAGRHESVEIVRSEVAAALAMPDLRLERQWPAWFSGQWDTMDFSPDLTEVVTPTPEGGFVLRRVADGVELVRCGGETSAEAGAARSGRAETFTRLRLDAAAQRVAATRAGGDVEVWSLATRAVVWRHERLAAGQAVRVALHPDGSGVAWTERDGSVRFAAAPGATAQELAPAGTEVIALAWEATGAWLAVLRAEGCEVRARDGALRWQVALLHAREAEPVWSPDGRWLALAAGPEHDVTVFDAATGGLERTLRGHTGAAHRLSWHPESRWLASVGWDGVMIWWDALAGEELLRRPAWVRTVAWSADGGRLAVSLDQRDLAVFAVAPREVFAELRGANVNHEDTCDLVVSGDGRIAATTDGYQVRLWDTAARVQGAEIAAHDPGWVYLTWPEAGEELLWSSYAFGIRRQAVRLQEGAIVLGGAEEIVAPGGEAAVVIENAGPGGRDWWVRRAPSPVLEVWPGGREAAARRLVVTQAWAQPGVSPDLRWVAMSDYPEPGITVWETTTVPAGAGAADTLGAVVARLPAQQHVINVFSPDGRWLVTGSASHYQTWRAGTWEPGPGWAAERAGRFFGMVRFSRDGRLVAARQADGAFDVRETEGFALLVRLIPPRALRVSAVAWAPDATKLYLLGHGHRLYVWDLAVLRRELAARGLDWE